MAIYHLRAQIISRANGSSALCAAAYRHGAEMTFDREDKIVAYTGKSEVAVTGLELPDATPAWLRQAIDGRDPDGASEALWNAVETFETRKNAQLAREIDAALPLECSREQNLEIIQNFAQSFTDRGMVVDWALHEKDGNPHVHMMMTMRPLTEDGFGSKKVAVLDANGDPLRQRTAGGMRIVYEPWAGVKDDLQEWRETWSSCVNQKLAQLGEEQRIDHRSYADRGLAIEPTTHLGVSASAIERKGGTTERGDRNREIAERNTAFLRANPEAIVHLITEKKAVFDETDIAKTLATYVEEPKAFQAILAKMKASEELVPLRVEQVDADGKRIDRALYSSREMIGVEREMADRAGRLAALNDRAVSAKHVEAAIGRVNAKLAAKGGALSAEQEAAIEAVTSGSRLHSVVGLAGTGKSTMLEAAREAWEAQGYRVRGVALAGKAADELSQASGIASRTLASLEKSLDQGKGLFTKNDVIVLDEAGMVGSRQMARLLRAAEAGEAKVVLVGDPAQLPAIAAGAAFRAVLERTPHSELASIRRQKSAEQREASLHFARGRTREALAIHRRIGSLRDDYAIKARAIEGLAKAVVEDREALANKGGSVLALAHRNQDVRALNEAIRKEMKARGLLGEEATYRTTAGKQSFAVGDRIVFLQNDASLGVKNGQLATVTAAKDGALEVRDEEGRAIAVRQERYRSLAHGFAVSIHKSQGTTVDRAHVLGSRSLNRNLTYVAMTRHREAVTLHASKHTWRAEAFPGGIVDGLSRLDDKSSTLDHGEGLTREAARDGAAIGFGERRGLDVRQALGKALRAALEAPYRKLEALTERLRARAPKIEKTHEVGSPEPTKVAAASKPEVAARFAGLAPATRFERSVEEVGCAGALEDAKVLGQQRALAQAIERSYAEPAAIQARIARCLNAPEGFAPLIAALRDDPASLGALRGKDGFFAGREAKEERREAIATAGTLASKTAQLQSTLAIVAKTIEDRERSMRKRAAVEVPALDGRALSLIERLDRAASQGAEALDAARVQAVKDEPEAMKQISETARALDRRLGRVGARQTAERLDPIARGALEQKGAQVSKIGRVVAQLHRSEARELAKSRENERGAGRGIER